MLAAPLELTTPAWAQDPSPANSTALNDWVQDARKDASREALEFFFDNLSREPSDIESSQWLEIENLEIASWQRDYSALSVWVYADQLARTQATMESAHAAAMDLQSQLSQARSAIGAQQSARIGEIESDLKQIDFTLKQATAEQGYLGSQLAQAESDLRQAQLDVSRAQWGVVYSSQVVPRVNLGVNFAAEHLPAFFIASDAFDLATNPEYRVQTSNAASSSTGLLLNVASYLLRDTFSGDHLLPGLGAFDQTVNEARTTYNAFEHQNEGVNLAFSGALSQLNLSRLPSYTPAVDFHDHSGSFFLGAANGPLAVYSRWTSEDRLTMDRFDTQSWYRFNGLETASGHVLTGSGSIVRDRTEQHDPFQFNAFLNALNFFNFSDTLNVTEKTVRHESYNDSFSGTLANRNIRRFAESNPQVNTFGAPSTASFYSGTNAQRPPVPSLPSPCRGIDPQCTPQRDTTTKRPPSLFPPPLPRDRPSPVPAANPASANLPPSAVVPTPSSPKATSSNNSTLAPGGITFSGQQSYSKHAGTDKQFDKELEGAEVVPAKKKQPAQ
jgi:hypothetical protein